MEKKTMMSDKDLSWFLGVEDETENESTSQECTLSLHGILRT